MTHFSIDCSTGKHLISVHPTLRRIEAAKEDPFMEGGIRWSDLTRVRGPNTRLLKRIQEILKPVLIGWDYILVAEYKVSTLGDGCAQVPRTPVSKSC